MKSLSYAIVTMLSVLLPQATFAVPQDYPQAQNSRQHIEPKDKEERSRAQTQHGERYRINISIHSQSSRSGRVRPDWKVGAPVPENYRYSDYVVDYNQYPNLPEPSRYQQWIKVDNRFILINVLTNTTLRIVILNPN